MSVAQIQKILVASYFQHAEKLMETLQSAGIMQILDAEQSFVSKEWPQLHTETKRPKDIEEFSAKINSAVEFLNHYAPKPTLAQSLAPLAEITDSQYADIIANDKTMKLLEESTQLAADISELNDKLEHLHNQLNALGPWENLHINLEDIENLDTGSVILGLIPEKNFQLAEEKIKDFKAGIEIVGTENKIIACAVIGLKENTSELYKILRTAEFEVVNLSYFKGSPAKLIQQAKNELAETHKQIAKAKQKAEKLSQNRVKLQTLADHYTNLLSREKTRLSVPESEKTIILEGWIKTKDIPELRRIADEFEGTSIALIEPAQDEETPIEIENSNAVKPFETITRLHGMPKLGDVDPTVFLAPFFAIFFGLCLTDAGYGILMTAVFWWLIKKFQGDKKALWMFLICSVCTIVAGALTGGWFGDAIQTLIPQETAVFKTLNGLREKMMLFDPMQQPMIFFALSLGLGYLQIMFALFIGLFNNLIRKDYATAFFNFAAWIIFLNSLALLILSKTVAMPAVVSGIAKWAAISQAVLIFLFSERKSGLAGRIGGGVFSLFSTVFYFGDILSYVRLMALGMVTAGLGIAVNILVQLVSDVPYIGFILGALLFVIGHGVNLGLSILSSFVHSLRLQFVEFFPKFFTGGGREFKPLALKYKHLLIKADGK